MQFVKPLPFREAVDKLGARTPIGSHLTSAQWRDVPVALRERAMFSSQVESLRFLQRAKDHVGDFLTGAREVIPDGQTALKLGSRAEFVKQLSAFAQAEGLGPLNPADAGTIKDITSQKRLELIIDTQTHQAQAYGDWKQGSDPDILDAFPAQRFLRTHDVKEPRVWHTQFENGVWLKSDVQAWIRINQDFGVPWGPWGWGCGHDVEDVDRAEAEQLGLIQPGETPISPEIGFNDHLQASTRGLDPEFLNLLRQSFGDQVVIDGETIKWKGQTDEGIRRSGTGDSSPGRINDSPEDLARRIGEAGRAVFGEVRSRDTGIPFNPEDAQSGGAHLAAVATGRKPLYHEQLDIGTASDVARRLWGLDLAGVQVTLDPRGHLFAYRPEIIQRIIDANPEAYPGFNLENKILRATLSDTNGDLLSYGARTMVEPGTVTVEILETSGQMVFGFRSRPEVAEHFAQERALDFSQAFGGFYTWRIKRLGA